MTSSTQRSYFLDGPLLALLLVSICCWSTQGWALTELDDSELGSDEVLDTKPLVGLKPGDEKMFAVDEKTRQAGVRVELLLDSMDKLGLQTDEWRPESTNTDVRPPPLRNSESELRSVQQAFASARVVLRDNKSSIDTAGYAGGVWRGPKQRVGEIDATIAPSLVASGVLSEPRVLHVAAHANPESWVMLGDYDSIKTLKRTYGRLQHDTPEDAHARAIFVADAYGALKPYPMLRKSVEVKVGQVTFGKPLVFSAEDKHLKVPPEWLKRYRVHWIQLALTLHDLVAGEITELTFLVSAPQDCVAAELAPIKVEKETETKKTLRSPEVKVEVEGVGVSLGSILGEEITFKTLIPTLIANGLQESDFSWSMMDEAIRKGSQRFVVVLLVPKAQKKMDLRFQVNARTKSMFTQGDVLATEPSIATIELH